MSLREAVHNWWYRWENVNLDTGESQQYRRLITAVCDKAVCNAVYGERWILRRSTLPSWYWRLRAAAEPRPLHRKPRS
jgi:hypothetical protein